MDRRDAGGFARLIARWLHRAGRRIGTSLAPPPSALIAGGGEAAQGVHFGT